MIKLLILDVDGVLTDGKLYFSSQGETIKAFHVHDGLGIKQLMALGVVVAIISSRNSEIVSLRMQELGVTHVYQGQKNKLLAFEKLLAELQLTDDQVAYVGDDLPDLPVMQRVGLAIAVANAVPEIKAIADWQCQQRGGDGAVREVSDRLCQMLTTSLTSELSQ